MKDKLTEYLETVTKPLMNKKETDWAEWLYYYALAYTEKNYPLFDYEKIDFYPKHLLGMDEKIKDILDNEDHTNPEIVLKLLSVMKDYQTK